MKTRFLILVLVTASACPPAWSQASNSSAAQGTTSYTTNATQNMGGNTTNLTAQQSSASLMTGTMGLAPVFGYGGASVSPGGYVSGSSLSGGFGTGLYAIDSAADAVDSALYGVNSALYAANGAMYAADSLANDAMYTVDNVANTANYAVDTAANVGAEVQDLTGGFGF